MRIKNVPVKVAAAILGKADQVVRCGLQHEVFKFGVAITTNPNRKPRPIYSYHISATKFKEYAGCSDDDILNQAATLGCQLKLFDDTTS